MSATMTRVGLVVVALGAASPECHPATRAGCLMASERAWWDEAAGTCLRVFRRSGKEDVGRRAARALVRVARLDEATGVARALQAQGDPAGAALVDGQVARARGDEDSAQALLGRAVAEAGRRGQRETEVRARFELHALLRARDQLGPSLRELAAVERSHRAVGDAFLDRQVAFAVFDAFADHGDYDRAERALRAAVPLARPEDAPYLHLKRGIVHAGRRNYALAELEYQEAARAAARLNDRRALWAARNDVAIRMIDDGRASQAAAEIERGWQEAGRHFGSAEFEIRYRVMRARAARAVKDLDRAAQDVTRARLLKAPRPGLAWLLDTEEAFVLTGRGQQERAAAAFQRAIAIVEAMRDGVAAASLRDTTLAARRRPYGGLFDLRVAQGRLSDALAVADRAQARNFLDALAGNVERGGDASLDLEGWAVREDTTRALRPSLEAAAAPPPSLDGDGLSRLGDDVLLHYFEALGILRLTVVHRGAVQVFPIAENVSVVARWVSQVRANPDDRQAARALGAILLPAPALPPAGSRLVVVPASVLARVPFAALMVGDQRLVARHALSLAPSLAVVARIKAGPREAGSSAVTVFGDPTGDLPGARVEAALVARELPGATSFNGPEATAARLQSLPRGGVLHVAAHSGVGPRGSWLRLADGEVTATELFAWRLAPRLVVLASCASAVSNNEGFWGSLAAAFLASGAPATLSTLWSVDDRAAQELVQRFYRQGGAWDPVEALARAQRELIDRPAGEWAPFVLLGTTISAGKHVSSLTEQPLDRRRMP